MNQEKINELEKLINNKYGNTTGIVVLKNGITVYEHYFNSCTSDSKIHIYSVTKSIISALIGIAIDKKYINNIDQKVLEFFPNYKINAKEKIIQDISIKDLITMTAPFKYRFAPYIKYFTSSNYVNFSLDYLGGKKQSKKFRYTPLIGPDILSGIISNSTGQTVLDFATENLFKPLNINIEKSLYFSNKEEQLAFNKSTDISGWARDDNNTNTAGWGLTLSTMDMAKIGLLYLNQGRLDKKQIVPEQWIKDSTSPQSHWDKRNLDYGYLWWVIDEQEHACAAMGDGGNVIYFNSKNSLVIAISGFFVPRAKDRIDLIKNHIEPLFQ